MNYSLATSIVLLIFCSTFKPAHAGDEGATGRIQPIVTTSELVVGNNRFAFGLMKDGKLLNDAEVTLKLYAIDGSEASLVGEFKVPYQKASSLKQELSVHHHPDGTEHVHGDESSIDGIYLTHLNFSQSGDWGIQLLVRQPNDSVDTVGLAVTVFNTQIGRAHV